VQFVIVSIAFEVIDDLLPVCCENVSVWAMKTLIDLESVSLPSQFHLI
jgi:hypothetical protein